MPEFDGIVISF